MLLWIYPNRDTITDVSGIFARNVVGTDGGYAPILVPPTVHLTMTWTTHPQIDSREVHTLLVPGTTEILMTIVRRILVSVTFVPKAIIFGRHLVGGQIVLLLLRLGALPTTIPGIQGTLSPCSGVTGPPLRFRGKR